MTKIFKVADTTTVPWWLNRTADTSKNVVDFKEATHIASMPADLTEDQLVEERDRIEQCANAKTTYRYSSSWSEGIRKQIVEYASICQVNAEAVDPTNADLQAFAAQAAGLSKTASTAAVAVNPIAELLGDPFHLDEVGDMKHMATSNWESVRPPVRSNDIQPIAMTSASVINIGSVNEASVPRRTRTVPGQNSLLDPNAIQTLAESKDENIVARMRSEAEARKTKRADSNRQRDAEMVAKAEAAEQEIPGITPRGSVLATDAKPATGGFKGGTLIASKDTMPELTAGETIRARNQLRQAEIKAKKAQDRGSWDTVQGSSRHEIDETFINSIKQQLGE